MSFLGCQMLDDLIGYYLDCASGVPATPPTEPDLDVIYTLSEEPRAVIAEVMSIFLDTHSLRTLYYGVSRIMVESANMDISDEEASVIQDVVVVSLFDLLTVVRITDLGRDKVELFTSFMECVYYAARGPDAPTH